MSWWTDLWGGGGDSGGGSADSGGDTDWLSLIMAGVSAVSSSKDSKNKSKMDRDTVFGNTRLQAQEARKNTEFELGLAKYYKDLDKQERRQGFGNFGQFSSRQYAPPAYTPPPVGAPPTAGAFEERYAVPPPTTAGGLAGAARTGG